MRVRYGSYSGFNLSPVLILIIVNFLLFIITLIVPQLVIFLGLKPGDFVRPWTIVTGMFLHAGFWHIFANMFTLYFFGSAVSRLIGILGNILMVLLAPVFPFFIAIGASGAVFALGGLLAAMRPKLKVIVFPLPVPIPLWIAVIGGFVILSFLPFVAWQAHLGGLIFGLILGYIFRKKERYLYY